jgi:aminopeptidase N
MVFHPAMTIFRSDYQPYPFLIPEVHLEFDLNPAATRIKSTLKIKVKPEHIGSDLILNGEGLSLDRVEVDGQPWLDQNYQCDNTKLVIKNLPNTCEVSITSFCQPDQNTSLMGLYISGHHFFTQCEAQGFRRITWFADRPDVMSIYTVSIKAQKDQYPVLLSNGNLISNDSHADGSHLCVWHDPFPKPCYLFALVAGQFDCREKQVLTHSGRQVLLQIFSDVGTFNQTEWAMQSLEQSLKWDEQRYNLELDLERFMIVAARDFNMGAMENKGLNIFNAAYVLANAQTATDSSFSAVQAVIGHEYFHNWTGNRVTCRDWFDLSLKEGLTVFRDQSFTADMMAFNLTDQAASSARAIKRIDDVITLRAVQFPEDNGPMAHPIRPESYQEISNFYTATVYEKGSEVIRMIHTLLGEETFQLGMRTYFERHDGQAVTCDDFVNAMESAWQTTHPEYNLNVFRRWYSQAGTPTVKVSIQKLEDVKRCRITLSQLCPPIGVEREAGLIKQPFHIPFSIGFVNAQGQSLFLQADPIDAPACHGALNRVIAGKTITLNLLEAKQSWEISGLEVGAVPSLLRDFSAPVRLETKISNFDLTHLARLDDNAFVRWESTQTLIAQHLLASAHHWRSKSVTLDPSPELLGLIKSQLNDTHIDAGYMTRLIGLPSDKYLLECMSPMDPSSIAHARMHYQKFLGGTLTNELLDVIERTVVATPYQPNPQQSGQRSLIHLALNWLCSASIEKAIVYAMTRYKQADNLTDRFGAMAALSLSAQHDHYADILTDFYESWQHEALVIDKWFALQSVSPSSTCATMQGLMKHPAFNLRNPNRARSVIFQFCSNNPIGFHQEDGSGYDFWAQQVIEIDTFNPEIAARLARVPDHWARHIEPAQSGMKRALQKVHSHVGLSSNTLEIISKSLTL